MKNETEKCAVQLRCDQWDLIALALEHVRVMTTGSENNYSIDKLGRLFLRRRCIEAANDIQSQVPGAGE